ncbi:MAG: DUF4349 domain-containing protein [Firmicutes bacterium]|nr:DUF4349 domain-containing protein [Bacillota bacterium]
MTCALDRSQLSAYLDQELTAEERAAVEAHLAACAECREEFASLGRVVQALRGLPEAQPPEGFREALRARLLAAAGAVAAAGDGAAPGAAAGAVAGPGAGAGRDARTAPREAATGAIVPLGAPAAAPGGARGRGGARWRQAAPAAVAAVLALCVGFGSAWVITGAGWRGAAASHRAAGLQAQGRTAAGTASGATAAQGGGAQGGAPGGGTGAPAGAMTAEGASAADSPVNEAAPFSAASGAPGADAVKIAPSISAPAALAPDRLRLVRTGRVQLKVASLAAAYTQALQIVALNGGEVVQGSFDAAGSEAAATLEVRVPAERLDALLASVAGLGTLQAMDVQATDVTARLRELDREAAAADTSPMKIMGSADSGAPSGDASAGATASGLGMASGTGGAAADAAAQAQAEREDLLQQVDWARVTIALGR